MSIKNIRSHKKCLQLLSVAFLFISHAFVGQVAFATDLINSDITPLVAGETARADDVNQNFNTIKDAINTKQDKLAVDCGAGSYVNKIDANGVATCVLDQSSDVTTLFDVADTKQDRLSINCGAGSYVNQIDGDGVASCAPDVVGGGTNSVSVTGGHLTIDSDVVNPTLSITGMPGITAFQPSTPSAFGLGTAMQNVASLNLTPSTNGFIRVNSYGTKKCGDDYDGWLTMGLEMQNATTGVLSPRITLSGKPFITSQNGSPASAYSVSYVFSVNGGVNNKINLRASCSQGNNGSGGVSEITVHSFNAVFVAGDVTTP